MQQTVASLTARTGEGIEKIRADAAKQIQDIGGKSSKVVESLGTSSAKHIEDIGSRSAKHIDDLSGKSARSIEEVRGKSAKYLEEVGGRASRLVEQLGERSNSAIEGVTERAKKQFDDVSSVAREAMNQLRTSAVDNVEDAGKKALSMYAGIKKAYEITLEEFKKQISATDVLIKSAGKLAGEIEKVEFPRRLDSMDTAIGHLETEIDSTQEMLERLAQLMQERFTSSQDEIAGRISRFESWADKTLRVQEEKLSDYIEQSKKTHAQQRLISIITILIAFAVAVMLYLSHYSGSESMPSQPPPARPDTSVTTVGTP